MNGACSAPSSRPRRYEGTPGRFYADLQRPAPWRAVIDDVLMAHVRIAFTASGVTYGAPRIHGERRAAGLPTSTKHIARLMREAGRVARRPKRGRVVTSALRMARDARHPAPGLSFHSNRGSRYASAAYRAELARHGMLASMSGTGNCCDHTVAERFFATSEFELIRKHDWHTRAQARRAIFRYLETWYNRKRRHSTLGYVSPAEYEVQLPQAA